MKDNHQKVFESYFRYLGEDASSIFDDLTPIDEARLLQEFMDVVEDNRFEVDEESEDIHMVIKGKVPNDLRVKLTQLLIFFWLDRSMEDVVAEIASPPEPPLPRGEGEVREGLRLSLI